MKGWKRIGVQAGVRGDGTHQTAFCHAGRRLCALGRRPTVRRFCAFLPGIPEVLRTRGLVPAVLPGGGALRAPVGIIAPDYVTRVHLLPKVLFDAALPGQCPPPGQQGPQAPTGAGPGAWAALGGRVPEAEPQLFLFTPTVQATVWTPGGRAAKATDSVFKKEVLGMGAGRRAPGFGGEPEALAPGPGGVP